jgi:transposase
MAKIRARRNAAQPAPRHAAADTSTQTACTDTSAGVAPVWTVDQPDAARFLATPEVFRFIAPFLGRSLTAAQAAAELDVSAPRVRYWAARAHAAGLLLAQRDPAGGATCYRMRANRLFLPAAQTRDGTLDELARAWSDPWQQMFLRAVTRVISSTGPVGLRIFREPDGAIDAVLARGPHEDIDYTRLPPMSGGWITGMWLDDDDARALQRELHALIERFAQRRSGQSQFIMRLALAPLVGPDLMPKLPRPDRGDTSRRARSTHA